MYLKVYLFNNICLIVVFFIFRTCVVVTLAAQIEIFYNVSKTSNYTGYVNIQPNITSASGNCGEQLQTIILQWNNTANVTNNVTLTFERKAVNSAKFDLKSINITISADNSSLPGINGKFSTVV